MRLHVLGCSGGSAPGRQLSCYLLDDVLAVDAGALTTGLELEDQRRIEAVLLTHAHLDHVWSFPLFLADRYSEDARAVALHGSTAAVRAVKQHLFNDALWPREDRFRVSDRPLVTFHTLEPGDEREVLPGWTTRAVAVDHVVPSQAYLIRHEGGAIIVSGDTGPTQALWEAAERETDVGALVVECSFPDDLVDLSTRAGHLAPSTLEAGLSQMKRDVRVLVTHIKPSHADAVRSELAALGDDRLEVIEDGQVLDV